MQEASRIRSAVEDGKDVPRAGVAEAGDGATGTLHRAVDSLRAARRSVAEGEDNAEAKDLRRRALHQIDDALRYTQNSISLVGRGS